MPGQCCHPLPRQQHQPRPLKLGRCCVADESSQFGGGERELRNIIIFKTNKCTDITVMTTRHYVPGGEIATE